MDGNGLTMEPVDERVLLSSFPLSRQELVFLLIIFFYVRQCSAFPPLFGFKHGWSIVYLLIQFPHSMDILHTCGALLN